MLEGQIINIPTGTVCIALADYSALLRKSVKVDGMDAEIEAAYNRGYEEGFAAGKVDSYENYLDELKTKKAKRTALDENVTGLAETARKAIADHPGKGDQKAPEKATEELRKQEEKPEPQVDVKGLDTLIDSIAEQEKEEPKRRKKDANIDDEELMKLRTRGYKMDDLMRHFNACERTIREHLKKIETEHPKAVRNYTKDTSISGKHQLI